MRKNSNFLKVKKDEAVKGADYEAAAALRDEAEKLRAKKDDIQKEWREKLNEVTSMKLMKT